jgi:hypothetical protein
MEAIVSALSGSVGLIILIAAILAFLLPFFVLRIRNRVISIDKKNGCDYRIAWREFAPCWW